MPLYDIQHSVPLSRSLKNELASQITHLHATTFTTPSLFININFTSFDASSENYYVAGASRPNGANRITGMVRTSEKRAKKDFDTLAEKIEDAWNAVVRGIEKEVEGEGQGEEGRKGKGEEGKEVGKNKKKSEADETETETEAKRLHAVFLYPMIAARESGVVIPTAGEESQWLQSNMPHFRERAETKGDEDFVNLLEEIENRDDLRKLLK